MDLVFGCPKKRDQLVDYYNSLSFNKLPQDVIETTIKCIMDVVACAAGGSVTDSANMVYTLCKESFPGKDSQVWSDGEFLSTLGAAFVNATMASDLDIDDGSRSALGHAGGTIIPALVAMGQRMDCSVEDLIVAIVLGYDIGVRFGESLFQITSDRFYGSGTWAVVGAAAGLCKILGLPSDVFLNSIGIAEAYASLSPVMKSIQNGSNTKETMGWASFSSIIAVELAQKGFLGVESMLYHKEESSHYFGLDNLGKEFRISKTYFKRYSACRWAHAPMEALMNLMKNNVFSPEEIKKITVMTHEKALSLAVVTPQNSIQAEYSIPFTSANIILFGQMGPEQLKKQNLSSQNLLDLAKKVTMIHSKECQDLFPKKSTANVEIELVNGEKFESGITSPKGDYDDPLSMDEIEKKYYWLTDGVWSDQRGERILEKIKGLKQGIYFQIKELFS